MKSTRLFAIAALSALIATSAVAQSGMDHAMPGLQVVGSDYRYSNPGALSTGWNTIEFRNTGREAHHLQLVRLPDGMTQASFLAKLKENEGAALASVEMVGGVGMLLPGQSQQVTLNLDTPGTYLELCFVPDEKGVPHLALGMVNTLQVKASAQATSAAPKADLKVKLMDFAFELPEDAIIQAGPQVWEVENAGPEGHEMAIMRLAPGKTLADLDAYMKNPEGPMPMIPVGGAQAVTQGRTSYLNVNLEAGDYVLLCFLPSPANAGARHAALGMVRPFTVVARTASR